MTAVQKQARHNQQGSEAPSRAGCDVCRYLTLHPSGNTSMALLKLADWHHFRHHSQRQTLPSSSRLTMKPVCDKESALLIIGEGLRALGVYDESPLKTIGFVTS